MTALADTRTVPLVRPAGASRAWLLPALLLLPCLAWIAFFFLWPLVLMCWRSLAAEGFSFETYEALFTSPLYTKVMITTVKTASIATVGALVLAYPLAYALTVSGSKMRGLLLVFILIPYWVDIIVRSFSWLILLGDNGLVNKALIGLGIVSAPLQLLYNPLSVLLAMVQILLPLTTVTLFGAMLRIDRTLIAAAKIHGASDWQAFRTVFFPLSLPGVYGAGLLVFVLALGFYVTPALLGSPRETMIAQTIMVEASQLLDWPQASAAGAVLLLITTAIAAIYNRYFSLDRLWGGSEKMSAMAGRIGLSAAVLGILVYLIFPVIVVVAISFSSGNFLVFPPPGFSLRWYRSIAADPEWVSALWVTLKVGSLSALIATLLGVPAAFALTRHVIPAKALLSALILCALVTPPIVTALSTYLFFVPLGLVNTVAGLACAHAVSGMPFVVINTAASLRSADVNLERAAVIHGAHPLWAILRITLPIISPGIVIGAIFAFVHSAHELLVATFVLGGVGKPVAVKIWSGVQATSDPTIAAASAILIGLAVFTFASAAATQSLARRRTP